ncbi:MAG: hypothetical protein H7A46_02340 [Verrucomicrobiales bacterium]|nr:hypothetical protein [Verrucomicrobiales bacterium]
MKNPESTPVEALPMPRMLLARQSFAPAPALDLAAETERQLTPLLEGLPSGATVAVAVGSRGITGLATLVRSAIDVLRAAGAHPFVVPAMGSHGGGTPAGQLALLADYGVSDATCGVPFQPSMEVRCLGSTADGVDAVCSAAALQADRILLINRIKPHTDFKSPIGSGLLKMLVVGLGKHEGAKRFHQAASRLGYEPALRSIAAVLKPNVPLLGGLAVVENQAHQTARLAGVLPAVLESAEEELCAEARALMPRLPFDEVDLLIVDRMGKNLSGTGMDPAIIGRMIHGYSTEIDPEQPPPRVRRLFVRDLTPESHGNAIGVGMADFTTDRLVAAMDARITSVNALTALSIQGAKVPIHFPCDRAAIEAALRSLALPDVATARVVRIRDTLSVETLECSESLAGCVRSDCSVEISGVPRPFDFDAEGNLAAARG